jgi:hypothetical protein
LKAFALLCFALLLLHFLCRTLFAAQERVFGLFFVCEVWGNKRGEGERIFGREEDGDGSNRRRNDALPLRLWFFSHSLSTISCLACCSI